LNKPLKILLIISVLFIFISCSKKVTVKPVLVPQNIRQQLTRLSNIKNISGLGEGVMKTPEKTLDGTVTIKLKKDELLVKVYSMGLLAGTLSRKNNIVKSDMSLEQYAKEIIAQGIISGIMWWDIDNYVINEEDGFYIIDGIDKNIIVKSDTMLPIAMKLKLKDGQSMYFEYKDAINSDQYSFPKEITAVFDGYYIHFIFDSINTE